jgi:hypothetical protein
MVVLVRVGEADDSMGVHGVGLTSKHSG